MGLRSVGCFYKDIIPQRRVGQGDVRRFPPSPPIVILRRPLPFWRSSPRRAGNHPPIGRWAVRSARASQRMGRDRRGLLSRRTPARASGTAHLMVRPPLVCRCGAPMDLRVYPSRLRYWRCTLSPRCEREGAIAPARARTPADCRPPTASSSLRKESPRTGAFTTRARRHQGARATLRVLAIGA